jgi:hypothetical protein
MSNLTQYCRPIIRVSEWNQMRGRSVGVGAHIVM